jgi:hypothetical protein
VSDEDGADDDWRRPGRDRYTPEDESLQAEAATGRGGGGGGCAGRLRARLGKAATAARVAMGG